LLEQSTRNHSTSSSAASSQFKTTNIEADRTAYQVSHSSGHRTSQELQKERPSTAWERIGERRALASGGFELSK
jgi:hypothetical protein